ncbi:D-alanine-D-alanine ligase [Parabacteroides sp. PFB2-12]|uniref:D-alanine--D-alanine ligase n=1 Tax=unclassified Parabacteroides TaxID=2649774 RepID=UPI002474FC54|nr:MULTISPECIES: D-alanine--D-alanine ligase [unclassified Parabacteroides]MDH6343367.1 D-alanine-D-alanine ligase [Parabacteroides sp. PM6-13]MDH6390383.1 D-alanine-D-alanine ligase [Parabacteroides sp. PFB2-12]
MKKNIAIIAGGDSSEIVVSLKSADGIYSFLDKEKYNVYIAIIKKEGWQVKLANGEMTTLDRNGFCFEENGTIVHIDFAYITIHGTPGENGLLQGYLEMMRIPYSCCGVLASALTFNKYMCNQYLHNFGVRIAPAIRLMKGETISDEAVLSALGLPLFVKPNDGGSSFGVTKVKTEGEIQKAIQKAFAEGNEVIMESYVEGTEVTCGCYKTKGKEVVFPLTEVVTDNEFFDFDAKYNGQVDEITPARISEELTRKIQQQTLKIYDLLGAKGLIRVDYIIPREGEPVVLEVNTTPGMTLTSFIPQQVKAAGLDIQDVLTEIIENEFNK